MNSLPVKLAGLGNRPLPLAFVLTMVRRCTRGGLIALLVILIAGCSRLTPQNLDKIKVGMTTAQVKEILGNPSDAQTQGAVGLTSTTYVYKRGDSEVKIVFLNDRVMQKNGTFK